jgi:hypothetical protein
MFSQDNVKDFGSIITNNARYARGINSRTAVADAAFNKKKAHLIRKLDLNVRKKIVRCYIS